MKRVLLVATAIAGLAFAAPSLAQTVSGSVGITGSVADRCVVNSSGGGETFSDTIPLGELTKSNGTLRGDLQGSSAISGATVKFSVTCTGSSPQVTLSATQLTAGLATPPSGFSDTIDYTAELDLDKAAGGTVPYTYNTATAAGPSTAPLGGQLSTANNNVRVSAYSFATVGGQSNVLSASPSYAATISVSIAPTL
ncbi:MAG TPA: hypothetical protein VGL66_00545 [Caulobacteraceae bacterium]|jgi:hypothetical protein